MKPKSTSVILSTLLSLCLAVMTLHAQVPNLLNYQGKLTRGGNPAAGAFNMTFAIYAAATGGTALWAETQTVTVTNGVFNVLLGSVTPFPSALFAGSSDRYLGIKVGTDPEMAPRFRLTSVAYAMRASEADGIADGAIVDTDVKSNAAIAGTKISPNFGSQNITTTGNVGIGIASPNGILEASHDGTAHDLVVDARGRVSIGDLQPVVGYSKLFVSSPDHEPGHFYIPNQNNSYNAMTCQTTGSGNALYAQALGAGNAMVANHTGPSGLIAAFQSNYVTKVGIDKNGNVGIGTVSPAARLDVDGKAKCMDTLLVASTGYGNRNFEIRSSDAQRLDATNDLYVTWGKVYPSSSIIFREYIDERFRIHTGGNVSIGYGPTPPNILTIKKNSETDPIADAWTQWSSRRWKENIKPISAALEKVQCLHGVTFDWKADGKHDLGLIAEEVGEVIPEVVAYEENGVEAKSVDYARLVALLIEAVKAQQQQIEELKAAVKSQRTE